MNERDYYTPYIAVIAAISADKGVDMVMTFDKAVSRDEFVLFLKKIREMNAEKPVHCFLDNLSAHKTEEVRNAFKEHKITPIFNVPYGFEF